MSNEATLLQQVIKLEEQALIEVYDRFNDGLYRYAMRLLGDENMAEDCVSETYRRFLEALQQHKGPRKHLKAYLYRIAHNWITDSYRRQRPQYDLLETQADLHPDADPSLVAARTLENQQLRRLLAELTPDQRQVITLKFLEDWSNEEIAAVLQKPVGAVKSLQHRGLRRLRLLMEGETT
jgi:RNA polymerase sigma-70 factor (ECF subfamily)